MPWNGSADAAALLATVAANSATPAIARASALTELHSRVSHASIELARTGLADPDPQVRIAALDMLEGIAGNRIWPIGSPLLSDSSRGVRIRAVSLLADVSTANQPATDREAFKHATAEFVAAQHLNADRPEARSTLGKFYTRRGPFTDAETEYKAGLRLSPKYASAAINYSMQGAVLHRSRYTFFFLQNVLSLFMQSIRTEGMERSRATPSQLQSQRRPSQINTLREAN
jgi:hypothetical protein